MDLDRRELKDKAAQLIRDNYWNMVIAGFVMFLSGGRLLFRYSDVLIEYGNEMLGLADGTVFPVIFVIFSCLITLALYPLSCGCAAFFMRSTKEKMNLSVLLEGYKKEHLKRIILTHLYRMGIVILNFLLLIIPGIMRCYDYYFVTYLALEYPEKGPRELCALSKQKARGHRWELFELDISFLLWNLAGALTYGLVGIFYGFPYRNQTIALAWRALCGEEAVQENKSPKVTVTAETLSQPLA